MKFGIVGVICFGIDYVIGLSVMKIIVKLGGDEVFKAASMAGSAPVSYTHLTLPTIEP